jgi:hypothetical protein
MRALRELPKIERVSSRNQTPPEWPQWNTAEVAASWFGPPQQAFASWIWFFCRICRRLPFLLFVIAAMALSGLARAEHRSNIGDARRSDYQRLRDRPYRKRNGRLLSQGGHTVVAVEVGPAKREALSAGRAPVDVGCFAE